MSDTVEIIPMREGVLAAWRDTWNYYDEGGRLLWSIKPSGALGSWVETDNHLLVLETPHGGLWLMDERGAEVWQVDQRGLPLRITYLATTNKSLWWRVNVN